MFLRMSRPWLMMVWDFSPLRWATKPIPQLPCSKSCLY